MRIFVTGGTGFMGSVVARELLDRGHEVIGLARSESSCKILEKLGASVFEGSLEDLASLHRGVDISDAVIHMAFIHDFSNFSAAIETAPRRIQ